MSEVSQSIIEGRNRIAALERELFALGGSTDFSDLLTHHFAPGIYARELFIPAGHVLTGKIHKTEHLNIVAQGLIKIACPEGRRFIAAPAVFVSQPGTKRAGFAIEDTTWITIHATEETDVPTLEDMLVTDSYEALEEFQRCRLAQS